MLARVWPMGEGKDLPFYRRLQSKSFPFTILKISLLFLALGFGFSVIGMYTTRFFYINRATLHPSLPMILRCRSEKNDDLSSWIMPPVNLMHNMSDEELFWRASFVPQLKEYPFKRVKKVAFMFLTRGPLPLAPLWEKFFKGHEKHYSIYIHSSPNYQAEFPRSSPFYRRHIPSKVAEWGKMSMCDAERRLLANALLDISNERFVLLSESCIPLRNFTTVYDYLTESRHSFIGSFDDPGPHGRGRYNPKMSPEVNVSQWRKGSQWFEVDREVATELVSDTRYYPKFVNFCRPACYVDEHYFPTMLSIEAPGLIANRSVTLVDWSRGGAHPATFGGGDIGEGFMKRILEGQKCEYNGRRSELCFLFARKFAPSALEPLLNLTNSLLRFS